jgi:dsRNA-specific ribonuclease
MEINMALEKERIKSEMKEFELILHYHFNEIEWLSKAMKSVLLPKKETDGKNHKEYSNEGLATVGDTIIKSVIADKLYRDGLTTKGSITDAKKDLENNETMHNVMINEEWINYAYNNDYFIMDNPPQENMVVSKEHDPYIEAIVAAIYYDSGNYDTTKRWILKFLIPMLQKNI